MADQGGGGRSIDWTESIVPEAFSEYVPLMGAGNEVGEEGMWNNNWVVDGMGNNWVVDGSMGEKGDQSMVGAARSDNQSLPSGLGEQGHVSNLSSTGFDSHAGWEWDSGWDSSFAVEVGPNATASGGSNQDGRASTVGMVESAVAHQAPPPPPQAQAMVSLGNKKGAERMGVAPPVGACGSKRRRTPSGSIETTGGVNDEAIGSEPLDQLAALVNLGKKRGAAPPAGAGGSKRRRTPSGSIETSGGSSEEAMGSHALDGLAAWANTGKTNGVWWDKVSRPGYTDADFKRDFHMSRSTFATLCNMLDSAVRKEDTASRDAIPVAKRVAVCIYRFVTGESFADIGKRFGVAKVTVHKLVHAITAAINSNVELKSLSTLWPRGADAMAAAAARFEDLTGGLPGVIGAVYTTHVPINAPKNDLATNYNSRLAERSNGTTSHSVALHAAVDADGAFTDVFLGNPGETSDEQLFFKMSTTHEGEMVAQGKRLVGGEGYPLTDWTLVPYTHGNLTQTENNFNEKVALARGVALDACRRLKARWVMLRKRGPAGKIEDFKSAMRACCVLHNLCERSGDELGDELKGFELEDEEMVLDDPVRSAAAAEVRDAIAHNLLHGSTMAHGSSHC